MELHQLQVIYQAEEDRLLYRASFKTADGDLQEIRAWLTRRLVQRLWPGLIGVLETQVSLDKPQAAHASADIVGMEHHACVEKIKERGSFDAPYITGAYAYPLGEEPILMTTVNFIQHPNQPIRMNMTPQQGRGFEIAFPLPVLHGFCSLLKDAVEKAEWQIQLTMPGAQQRTYQLLN